MQIRTAHSAAKPRIVAVLLVALLAAGFVPGAPSATAQDVEEGRPDLIVQDVQIPAGLEPGDGAEIRVTVANIGNASAEGYFSVRGTTEHGQFWFHAWVYGLAAGENTTVNQTQFLDEGYYALTFTVDDWEAIDEANETNNAYALDLTIGDPKPDFAQPGSILIPANVHDHEDFPWPSVIREGDEMYLYSFVQNIGTAHVAEVLVHTYLDDVLFDERVLAFDDAPGDDLALLVNWTASIGTHTFRIELDPLDQIEEKDETNNVGELTFTVLSATDPVPDLAIVDVQVPAQAAPGDSVSIQVTFENTGDISSPAFDVALYAYRVGTASARFPGLDPGETGTVTLTGSIPLGGHYWDNGLYWSAVVDPWWPGEVPEDIETNNYWYASIPLLLADLEIADVRIPDGQYREGETAYAEVDILNNGTGGTRISFPVEYYTFETDGTFWTGPLAAGEKVTLVLPFEVVAAYDRLFVWADRNLRVADSDFFDDREYVYFESFADLAVGAFTSSADDNGGVAPATGHTTFEVELVNEGFVISEEARVAWYVDGVRRQYGYIPADGDTITDTFSWRPIDDTLSAGEMVHGEHEIRVEFGSVDPWEVHWDENSATKTVYIKLTPLPRWV